MTSQGTTARHRHAGTVAARGVVDFLGTKLDAVTYREAFDLVDHWIKDKQGRSHHIACINAFCVSLAHRDSRLRRIYNGADIAGPDGMPFLRWVRWRTGLPCDRIAAPDTILALAQESEFRGYTFYLYGGSPEMVLATKSFLEERFPHIRIVGYRSPPFRPMTKEEDEELCREINALKPDIICVGLGTPKQDFWIDDHLGRIHGAVFIASGATFDFFGGRVRFAPEWIRTSGFEWLYRLLGRDFLRLWRRYTVHNARFCLLFLLQLLALRRVDGDRWIRPQHGMAGRETRSAPDMSDVGQVPGIGSH